MHILLEVHGIFAMKKYDNYHSISLMIFDKGTCKALASL